MPVESVGPGASTSAEPVFAHPVAPAVEATPAFSPEPAQAFAYPSEPAPAPYRGYTPQQGSFAYGTAWPQAAFSGAYASPDPYRFGQQAAQARAYSQGVPFPSVAFAQAFQSPWFMPAPGAQAAPVQQLGSFAPGPMAANPFNQNSFAGMPQAGAPFGGALPMAATPFGAMPVAPQPSQLPGFGPFAVAPGGSFAGAYGGPFAGAFASGGCPAGAFPYGAGAFSSAGSLPAPAPALPPGAYPVPYPASYAQANYIQNVAAPPCLAAAPQASCPHATPALGSGAEEPATATAMAMPQRTLKQSAANMATNIALLVALLLVAAMALGGSSGMPVSIAGYSWATVLTDSMTEVYPRGTLVVAQKTPSDSIRVGDDIMFMSGPDVSTTHRVVEVVTNQGTRSFRTQGTSNPKPDQELVYPENVIGKIVWSSGPAGEALTALRENWPYVAFLAACAVVLKVVISRIYGGEGEAMAAGAGAPKHARASSGNSTQSESKHPGTSRRGDGRPSRGTSRRTKNRGDPHLEDGRGPDAAPLGAEEARG